MRLVGLFLLSLGLAACSGNDTQVCPTGWTDDTTAPHGCAPPAAFTAGLPVSSVYGFVRTTAHGGNKLVVGTDVFVVADSNATCQAPSVNPIAQTTTNTDGIFTMTVPPGTYRITSGEVPSCTEFTVDATASTDVPLTYP